MDTRGRPVQVTIDSSAFAHNLAVADALAGDAEVIAVLKANAYGHGAATLCHHLGDHMIAVASVEEAIGIRQQGIANDILILAGPFDASCVSAAQQYRFSFLLHSAWQLALFEAVQVKDDAVCVWLKFDSGMHRLGFDAHGLDRAVRFCRQCEAMHLRGLMTHFANADEDNHPFVAHQLSAFDSQVNTHQLPASAANSGALLHYAHAHYDYVRPGIILYGASPNPRVALHHDFRPAMAFTSKIIALRHIAIGESVGYGQTWVADKPSHIATVAVGYADGYPRHAKSATPVAVNGERARLVGRVSMDLISVDVSDLPAVAVGDPVELWGHTVSVDEVAAQADTIAYTLLTSITERVKRRYI